MSGLITILGFGPVGRAAGEQLLRKGHSIRVAQRKPPADLPAGASFMACDVLNAASVEQAIAGSAQVVLAVGFEYSGKVWREAWPRAMANVLAACARAKARLVFVDNLYMYGPQTAPLKEDMPLAAYGQKPAARAQITRQWMTEAEAGRVKVAALRGPDFYGPNVILSHLGDQAFGNMARGKRAMLLVPPDLPHDYAYVPDFGRAVMTLLEAPDDCFNQAWHVPCAPIQTSRQILEMGAKSIGVAPKIMALPMGLLPVFGLFVPFMRNLVEMRFQWQQPYHVDWSKFGKRFWTDATPFAIGAAATARSFVPGPTMADPARGAKLLA
jgi:nucleoside-diphosphate-sugar epimerase